MSINDRLREAAVWVHAHGGETITVTLPREALAEALHAAADDPRRWPWELTGWVRDNARRTDQMCGACYEAATIEWDPYGEEPRDQHTHNDCTGATLRGRPCMCPHPIHHEEAAR